MTRQDLITRARNLLDEQEGKPGFASPFVWSDLADLVCDELARLDCYYAAFTQDVVSGQQSYVTPALYRITALVVTDAGGNAVPVEMVVPELMDERIRFWRTAPEQGSPRLAVMQGVGAFLLYPTPNYALTGGISVEGFTTPSTAGAGGANVWPNLTDSCPLPARIHMAIPFGMAFYRTMQYPTPENRLRTPMLRERWEFFKGEFMRELEDMSPAERFGDAPETSRTWMGAGTLAGF